jgi:hypothetical protein
MMQETGAKQTKGLIKTISAYIKEDGYPPTKGERRDAKRAKAKKMKVIGAGTKNLQRIIGRKAKAASGMDKQSSEATAADPEAAKRAASRARQKAGVGEEYPAPYGKDPKPSFAAIERPEGTRRTSAGQGGAMVAFGKKSEKPATPRVKPATPRVKPVTPRVKSEKQLVKAISTYLKEDTPKYNKKAVDTAIKRDKSIGKKEAKAIHGLLRGRQKSDS